MEKILVEKILKQLAKEQAEKYGYKNVHHRERIRDDFSIVYIQHKTMWFTNTHRGGKVKLRYRFDNPRLDVYDHNHNFAFLEFGDSETKEIDRIYYKNGRNNICYKKDKNFIFKEAQIFGVIGISIFNELFERFNELLDMEKKGGNHK